jgi:flagellar motility protein MotE (MotC chaperone)
LLVENVLGGTMVSRIVIKKHAFASLLISCLVLLQSITMVPSTAEAEGNSKAVQKVKDDYQTFAAKAKADFEAFKKQAEQNYENLKALAEADYKQLHQKAEADYNTLVKRYDSRKLDL